MTHQSSVTKPVLLPLIIAILLLVPSQIALASNGQTPNYQIVSGNTHLDNGEWERFSMTVSTPYTYTGGYDYQMNAVLEGCAFPPNACQGLWWLQGVASVGGGQLTNWTNVVYWDNLYTWAFWCQYTPTFFNVNQAGYSVVEQTTIYGTTQITYKVTIVDNHGNNVYQNTQLCPPNPSGYTIATMNKIEGVIVGPGGGSHASFTPLNTQLFNGYIDLVSNTNSLSSASLGTQTLETSNLYQIALSRYEKIYGSMYLYTVISNENTKSST